LIIDGPESTPFLGGKFIVNLDFNDSYPFKAPKIKFVTKIYHPNVKTSSGEICTQAIEQQWVPTLGANFIIQAVLTVIKSPNADNPQENDIAAQYKSNYNQY
jgi:hypothetical protein